VARELAGDKEAVRGREEEKRQTDGLRQHSEGCGKLRAMGKLIESDVWATFLGEVAGGGYADFGKVFQMLEPPDIGDLAALVMGQAGVQRDGALQILFARCMQNNRHVKPENLKHLCPALKEYVVEGYPEKKLGQSAWTFWRQIDPEASAEYLRAWVKQNGISPTNAERLTIDLTFGNEESVGMLRSYAEANPDVQLSKTALMALERSASDWKKTLEKYGREWKKKRTYETLAHLTEQLVGRAPREGVLVAKIVEVLGEPDSLVSGCYTFYSKEKGKQTGYLYLETDKQGKVTGWKLDNVS